MGAVLREATATFIFPLLCHGSQLLKDRNCRYRPHCGRILLPREASRKSQMLFLFLRMAAVLQIGRGKSSAPDRKG